MEIWKKYKNAKILKKNLERQCLLAIFFSGKAINNRKNFFIGTFISLFEQ